MMVLSTHLLILYLSSRIDDTGYALHSFSIVFSPVNQRKSPFDQNLW